MTVGIVTGATGFIGSHLTRALVTAGWKVHVLKRVSSSTNRIADIESDLRLHNVDAKPMKSVCESIGAVDVVFHLATQYGREGQAASDVVESNVLFPLQLLEHVNWRDDALLIATDTCYPESYPHLRSYTLSKRHFAQWGRDWAERTQQRFVNLALQHPFGPNDSSTKFVSWIVDQCLRNVEQIDLTTGRQQKDFVYVSDVVMALMLLAKQRKDLPIGGSSIPCGSGASTTLRTFIEMVHSLSSSTSILNFGAIPIREGEPPVACADTRQLLALGWKPETSLEEGIRLTLEHARAKLD